MNKIKLFSIILPRLEVFFLEEWIDHHLSLGVDSISLYDNGEFPIADENAHWKHDLPKGELERRDSFRLAPKQITWDKKPHLNYFEEIPYSEIKHKLQELEKKYKQLKVIPWVCLKDHKLGYPTSQFAMIQLEANQSKDWLLNIDADEFIHLNHFNDLKELINHYNEFNYFSFYPKLAESRKVGIPIKELKTCKDIYTNSPKWMCKPKGKAFTNRSAHMLTYPGKKMKHLTKEAFYYHYKLDGVITIKTGKGNITNVQS